MGSLCCQMKKDWKWISLFKDTTLKGCWCAQDGMLGYCCGVCIETIFLRILVLSWTWLAVAAKQVLQSKYCLSIVISNNKKVHQYERLGKTWHDKFVMMVFFKKKLIRMNS